MYKVSIGNHRLVILTTLVVLASIFPKETMPEGDHGYERMHGEDVR